MPELAIGAAHISYEIDGPADAPVLLLSHSLGTTRDLWQPQLAAFASVYRVVRYDTRGHGQSCVPRGEYALDHLGRDAIAVLDAVGASRAHVVGLSLGGLTAMWLGVHAPDRVDRLVLANTAARIGTPERWDERMAQARAEGMPAIAAAVVGRWFSDGFRARHPETCAHYQRMVASCSAQGYAGCCAVLRDADLRDDIRRITAPTLIIAGEWDVATPLADADLMRTRISRSTLVTLPAAHLSSAEQPAAFTDAVLDFLAADAPKAGA
jgi:3-oxoadipate enol-lactonase